MFWKCGGSFFFKKGIKKLFRNRQKICPLAFRVQLGNHSSGKPPVDFSKIIFLRRNIERKEGAKIKTVLRHGTSLVPLGLKII